MTYLLSFLIDHVAYLAIPMMAFPFPRILFDKPDDSGAGSEPEPTPESSSGIDGDIEEAMKMTESLSNPDADPPKPEGDDPAPGEDDDSSKAVPDESEPTPKEADDEPEYRDDFDPNDTVEVDGSTYFYHPKEHAPDVKHGNVYRSRDDAEIAWTHKVNKIHELTGKLNELGKGVGPAELPDWFSDPDNLDGLKQKADIEEAIGLPNDQLRGRLKDGDNLITYLDTRLKRVDQQAGQQKVTSELQQKAEGVYKTVNPLIDELGLDEAIEQATSKGDPAVLVEAAGQAIQKKIDQEVKSLEKEYQDYKGDADARVDDDNYADNLEKKRDAIADKRRQLERKYNDQYLSPFNKLVDVEKEIADFKQKQEASQGMSEKERVKEVNDGFLDLQAEMAEKHPIFLATDKSGAETFRDWAMARAEKFDGLLNGYQWGKALKSFDQHIEERRADVRRKKVEADNKKDEGKTPPPYGDQKKLTDKKDTADPQKKLDAEMEALMEETEATLKS